MIPCVKSDWQHTCEFMNLVFLISNTKRNSVRVLRVWRSVFHFHPLLQKRLFVFAGNGGNEYRQKAFQSHARNSGCRYPGGFQRRAGRPSFGTRSCSQGLVCYTFCSARRAKGWCRLLDSTTSPQKAPEKRPAWLRQGKPLPMSKMRYDPDAYPVSGCGVNEIIEIRPLQAPRKSGGIIQISA